MRDLNYWTDASDFDNLSAANTLTEPRKVTRHITLGRNASLTEELNAAWARHDHATVQVLIRRLPRKGRGPRNR
eukprot:7390270-Pyramimonas_sp.AAC.1